MQFLRSFGTALVGSVAGNLVVLFLLGPVVVNPAMPLHALSLMPVVLFTIVGVIGATAVYAVMRHFMARPQTAFFWVSAAVLVVSFLPDYLVIGQTTGPFAGGTIASASVLMLMHVVVAVFTVWALVKGWGFKKNA